MNGVIVEYKIPMGQVNSAIKKSIQRVTAKLNAARDEILEFAGTVQVKSYTASSNPAPPPASTYTRTFALQSAFKTQVTSTQLPTISGEWSVDETIANYAPFVVGRKSQQAKIHRGRWKSVEETTAIVKGRAQVIIKKHLKEQL
jgi:hypothetical protein